MNTDERLRRALARQAASMTEGPDRWAEVEADAAAVHRRNRRRAGALSGLGLVAAVGATLLVVGGLRDTTRELVETRPANRPPEGVAPGPGGAPLLWPFRNLAEARQWQRDGAPGGHSPWHADAGATALAFTTGYLGLTDIDQVIGTETVGGEARVAVGYLGEGGDPHPAATIRLIRLGDGEDAPWEVVGTVEDQNFTITAPTPGAPVASPLTVTGLITGVDESIRVEIHQPSSPRPLGETCCEPAGGERSPWRTTVAYEGAADPTLTVVASTGGHLTSVERFVVVGVAPRRDETTAGHVRA